MPTATFPSSIIITTNCLNVPILTTFKIIHFWLTHISFQGLPISLCSSPTSNSWAQRNTKDSILRELSTVILWVAMRKLRSDMGRISVASRQSPLTITSQNSGLLTPPQPHLQSIGWVSSPSLPTMPLCLHRLWSREKTMESTHSWSRSKTRTSTGCLALKAVILDPNLVSLPRKMALCISETSGSPKTTFLPSMQKSQMMGSSDKLDARIGYGTMMFTR